MRREEAEDDGLLLLVVGGDLVHSWVIFLYIWEK